MSKVFDFIIANAGWIIAIIGFCIPPVREFFIKKFQSSLDKALEDRKSLNDRKNYISKTRFDTEFQIYRELSKSFFNATKKIHRLIPYGVSTVPVFENEKDKDKYEHEIYQDAFNDYIIARDALISNAPFIRKDIYDKYYELLEICNLQLNVYFQRWNLSFAGLKYEERMPEIVDYKRTKEMTDKFEKLNDEVRNYLANLDVL